MTEINRDLADVKTGNISLQPIKDQQDQPIKQYIPLVVDLPPPSDIPDAEFKNGTFTPGSETNDLLSTKGISSARPELIAVTKFEPCWDATLGNQKTATHDMLMTQAAARRLREENLNKFVQYLQEDSETKPIIDQLLQSFNNNVNLTSQDIENIRRVWTDFDNFMFALQFYEQRVNTYNSAADAQNGIGQLYDVEQVFTKQGFNPDNIKFWSNTKVVGQMLQDLSFAARKWTFGMFPNSSGGKADKTTRSGDVDPFTYRSFSPVVGFSFNVENYVNAAVPTNGFDEWRTKGANFMPASRTDKLKLIPMTLSKVLGGSRVHIIPELSQRYQTVTQAPITNVKNFIPPLMGRTSSIAQTVTHTNSVLGTLRITTTPAGGDQVSNTVLPLERRDVSYNTSQVINAASGYDYFFSGLTSATTGDNLNTQRISDFKGRLFTRLNAALDIIDVMCLTDSNISSDINPQTTLDVLRPEKILEKARIALTSSQLLSTSTSSRVDVLRAIFYHAANDRLTKLILQQILFVVGWKYAIVDKIRDIQIIDDACRNEIDQLLKLPNLQNITYLPSGATKPIPISTTSFLNLGINTAIGTDDTAVIVAAIFNKLVTDLLNRLATIIPAANISNSQGGGSGGSGGVTSTFSQVDNVKQYIYKSLTEQNLLKFIFDFIADIENSARFVQNGTERSLFPITPSGTTNFMNLSASMRLLMYFELFISLIGDQKIGSLVKSTSTSIFNLLRIVTYPPTINAFKSPSSLITITDNTIVAALKQDRLIIQSMTSLLRAYITRIVKFYNTKIINLSVGGVQQTTIGINNINAQPIILNERNARRILVSKQQTALSMLELDDIKRSLDRGSIFSDDNSITPVLERLLLDKLLKSPGYNEPNLMKILTIGLCPGTNSIIEARDKTTRSSIPRRNWRQSDIVTVDVYVKNLLEEDVIFKPLQFPFELSRFVNMKSFDRITDSELAQKNYDYITRNFVDFVDVSLMTRQGSAVERKNGVDTAKFERYKFLDVNTLRSIFRNHTTSYLLGLYIKLLTGVSTQEKSFLFEPEIMKFQASEQTNNLFRQLSEVLIRKNSPTLTLQQFIAKYPQFGQKLQQSLQGGQFGTGMFEDAKILDPALFENASDIIIAQDLYDISKLNSAKTTLTGGEKIRTRVTSPKLFERIFNVPAYLPDFEVDVQKTNASQPGTNALTRLGDTGLLTLSSGRTYFRWYRENVRAAQFWATISTLDV